MYKISIKKESVRPRVVYIYDLGHYVNNAFANTVASARSCSRFLGISPPPLLQIPMALVSQFRVPAADIYFLEGGACLAVGVFKKMLTGAKIVLRNGDPLFYTLRSLPPYKREVLKFMIRRVDGILSDSKLSKKMARLYTRVPNEVAYPYVNVGRFLPVKPNLRSFNLLYLGVLNEFKGVDILVDAFELIKKEFNNSTLYLCGKFLGSRKLETKIRRAEGVSALGFHPVPQEIMARCSVYLNVARVEPFGINVLEAMCAGLIPIVSENVGAKEVVRELDPSLVVSLDPAEIAKKVAKVFRMPYSKKVGLSRRAKKLASRFTREWSLQNFKEKFWNVVSESYG